jgi:hypothetical protein
MSQSVKQINISDNWIKDHRRSDHADCQYDIYLMYLTNLYSGHLHQFPPSESEEMLQSLAEI